MMFLKEIQLNRYSNIYINDRNIKDNNSDNSYI